MVKVDAKTRIRAAGSTAVWALVASAVVATSVLTGAQSASATPISLDVTSAPYNAVGDGVTNDRAAIQAALDDAGANPGGGTVTIPSGKTFLSGGITIPSDVTLELDGVLQQSQNPSDYATTVTRGKYTTSGVLYDQWMLHNDPFVLSKGTTNAVLTGTGTVQMTYSGSDATNLFLVAVAFLNAQDFLIENVNVRGAHAFNVAIYGSTNGVLQNTNIQSDPIVNTDGVSVINTQNLHVTGNTVTVWDDGMYAVTRIVDDRDYDPTSWWTERLHQPTKVVEFDHNTVVAVNGFSLRGTIQGVPDLREVETTDISVHDNTLHARTGSAVYCWPTTEKSPMVRYHFYSNTYINGPSGSSFSGCTLTDFYNDFGAKGSPSLLNGDFENTGDAWWSPAGDAGAVPVGDAALVSAARTASSAFTGYVGYLQNYTGVTTELAQGLGLGPLSFPAGMTVPAAYPGGTSYTFTADVDTSGNPVRLFAYDTCTSTLLASQTVSPTTRTTESLTFSVPTTCGNVRVGIDNGSSTAGWALIDNAVLHYGIIDDADATVAYTGTWTAFTNTPTADVLGTRTVLRSASSTATTSFVGKRAWVVGVKGVTSGITQVWVDGTLKQTLDNYSATTQQAQVLYDTGVLDYGTHVVKFVVTNTKNTSATNYYFGFDALLVDQTVIDDNDPSAVTYTGTWSLFTNTPADNVLGTRHVGRTTGATATMGFTGTEAWIVGNQGPTLGEYQVWLDGVLNTTIDAYGPAVQQGLRVWDSGPLTLGSHTVKIVLTGTHNPASTGILVVFDALLVDAD